MPAPSPCARARAGAAAIGAALVLLLAAPAPVLAQRVAAGAHGAWRTAAEVPIRFVARLVTTGCGPDSVPQVVITGSVEVGMLGARILFRREAAGARPGPAQAEGQVDVLPAGTSVPIPPQLVRATLSDSLFCFIQLEDARGRALSDPLLAGRCVDGTLVREVAGLLPVELDARIQTEGCGDRQGPRVSLTGSLRMGGVWARLTFRATPDPLVLPPAAAAVGVSRDISLLAPGRTASILGSPAFGAGDNPVLYAQLTLGSGIAAGPEVRLGRCSDLTP